jgi:hypothetical protein
MVSKLSCSIPWKCFMDSCSPRGNWRSPGRRNNGKRSRKAAREGYDDGGGSFLRTIHMWPHALQAKKANSLSDVFRSFRGTTFDDWQRGHVRPVTGSDTGQLVR